MNQPTSPRSTPSGRRPRPAQVARIVAVLVAVPVIVWSVARLTGNDDEVRPGGLAGDPGVSHVHGLGINPADGSLYVATHYGTFRVPEGGEAERIGGSFQDTMGFTVVGNDTFLGSGHPDLAGMQAGQPGLLGLIQSTDGGESWQSLSLAGEVDFHALAYAHGRVYGWDSTSRRFMVSDDQQQWDERATLDIYGFAVNPDDADHLVGAAPAGIRTTTDGGQTWSDAAEPAVVAIAWAPDGTLWGIEADGTVQRSTDGGRTWAVSGTLPGEPQALLATGDELWAAAHDTDLVTGIYRSTDSGTTWDLRYQDPNQ